MRACRRTVVGVVIPEDVMSYIQQCKLRKPPVHLRHRSRNQSSIAGILTMSPSLRTFKLLSHIFVSVGNRSVRLRQEVWISLIGVSLTLYYVCCVLALSRTLPKAHGFRLISTVLSTEQAGTRDDQRTASIKEIRDIQRTRRLIAKQPGDRHPLQKSHQLTSTPIHMV